MGRLSLGLRSIVVYVPSNRRLERNLVPDRPAYSKLYPWDSNHSCQPRMCPEGGPVNTFSLLNMKSQFRKRLWGPSWISSGQTDTAGLSEPGQSGPTAGPSSWPASPSPLASLLQHIPVLFSGERSIQFASSFRGPSVAFGFPYHFKPSLFILYKTTQGHPLCEDVQALPGSVCPRFPAAFSSAVRGRLPVCLTCDSSLAHLARSRVSAEVCGMNG